MHSCWYAMLGLVNIELCRSAHVLLEWQKKESSKEQGFLKKRVGVRVDDRASKEIQRGLMKNQHGLCMWRGFERGCVGACGSEDPEESVRILCIGLRARIHSSAPSV